MNGKLSFGVHLPLHAAYDYKALTKTTLKAERLGYDCITVGDHFFLPPESYRRTGGDPERPDKLDAWTILASLATQTSRIKLCTRVSPLPFYQPARLAKVVTTVDIISGGRVVLGVGSGWYKDEALAYGVGWGSYRERVEKMAEELEIILKLWSTEKATFEGKYYNIIDAPFWPKPVQKPHPPIWFGGNSDVIVNAAVKYGDGLFALTDLSLEKLIDLNRRLIKREKYQGKRRHIEISSALSYPDGVGGTSSEWLRNVDMHVGIGISLLLLDFSHTRMRNDEVNLFLKDFADTIFPRYKKS